MYGIFNLCNSLETLPDLSKWDTRNVTDISLIFSYLTVKEIPDISKWNTSNVKKMF